MYPVYYHAAGGYYNKLPSEKSVPLVLFYSGSRKVTELPVLKRSPLLQEKVHPIYLFVALGTFQILGLCGARPRPITSLSVDATILHKLNEHERGGG
jgi:hypothetical protein